MKIVIAGNYGAGNLGDEMILEGILEMLKSLVPSAEITILSGDPAQTAKQYGLKALKKFPAGLKSFLSSLLDSKTKRAVRECDYFILGGGGLFGSLTLRANFIWGIQAAYAYRYGKPVIMLGQGLEPLRGKTGKTIVRKVFRRASLISVRDLESKKILESLGIKKRIYVAPDFAFRKVFKLSRGTTRRGVIVALRQMSGLPKSFEKQIVDFLNFLIAERKLNLRFIDFQRDQDTDLHRTIISQLSDKSKVEHITLIKDSEELLRLFEQAEFALCMRLHSVISAIKTGTPFIAINYAPKVEAFLKYFGLEQNQVGLENQDLKAQFAKISPQPFQARVPNDYREIESALRDFFAG